MAASLRPDEFEAMHTLGDVARHHGRMRGDTVALRFEGRAQTFAELDAASNRVANALIAAGVKPGEAIAYLGKNSDAYFELLLGASKAGAVTAPIGWRLAPGEVAYILADADAKALFVGPECIACAEAAVAGRGGPGLRVAMEQGPQEWPRYATWRDAQSSADPGARAEAEDAALLLYTSGTTGRPKGVMLSSANLLRSRRVLAEAQLGWNEFEAGEISLTAMPAAHIGGTGWGLVGLINGVTGIVLREFNPAEVLDVIAREGVGKMFIVPAALQFMVRLRAARAADFSRLRHILYGASPIPVDLLRECMEVFGCQFVQQYGLTETTGTIVYLPPEDHDPRGNPRMRAAGVAMPGVELRILSPDGEALPAGEIGEVATRSAANMKGYWRNGEATRAMLGADGWLRTGDAGYLDADGYLYIQDRLKDVIISGAENVYPAEVENAIHGHPHVAEVAVIGVPDETWGEAVKAIVVPKPGIEPDGADIIAFARSRIAHYKAPKSVDFLTTPLPRSASGKILRRVLREPYWQGRERRVN